MRTIPTVMNAVDSDAGVLVRVRGVVIPIMGLTLGPELLGLFGNIYDLVDAFALGLRSISPNMWPTFELTCRPFKSEAINFLDDASLCFLLVLHDRDSKL